MKVLVTLDVAEHPLGQAGADAGQETREGGGHDAAEGAEVNRQHDQGDGDVEEGVVVEPAQHGAPRQLDEDKDEAEEDGKAGGEHGRTPK